MRRDSTGNAQEGRKDKNEKIRVLKTILFRPNFFAIGSFFLVLNFVIGVVFSKRNSFSPTFIGGLIGLAALYAYWLAKFQYSVAQKSGAQFILGRFSVKPLDLKDSVHGQYYEMAEELKNAPGLPTFNIHIIPNPTINALALVDSDGTPCLALTDGMLAGFTREEIETVVIRELALVDQGDALYLTLVCSLADFVERFRSAFNFEERADGSKSFSLSSRIRRFLSRSIDPECQFQADAAAVERGRNPVTLAKILAKSYAANSSIEDFGQAYAPLLFVAPESMDQKQGMAGWLAGIHPPLMTRIRRLAIMADQKTEDIIPQDILQSLLKKPKNAQSDERH